MTHRFEARVSPLRTLLVILGSIAFFAASLWFVTDPGALAHSHLDLGRGGTSLLGWVGILFSGLCAAAGVRQLFQRGPVIVIVPEGVTWRRRFDRAIPWDAFDRAALVSIHRQRFVTLWLRDSDAWLSSSLSRGLADVNRALGCGDVSLSVTGLDRSFDELAAAVLEFAPALFDAR